ncbi:MAG: type II toxin-antitoxin system death-on-curing family toxin [Nocardioidaceae bacterium]
MIYLTMPELIHVAERTLSGQVLVRDHGLLQSELARPQTGAFGSDAYTGLEEKAAALLHSLAQPCVGGRQQAAGVGRDHRVFLGVNGRSLTMSNDEAYDLVMSVAVGELEDGAGIAGRLEATEPR